MNSSFNLKDGWTSGNQYDIGVVQYLTGPESSPGLAKKSSSSISDEFKILVEPSVSAIQIDIFISKSYKNVTLVTSDVTVLNPVTLSMSLVYVTQVCHTFEVRHTNH
jgi:hypothetical protein